MQLKKKIKWKNIYITKGQKECKNVDVVICDPWAVRLEMICYSSYYFVQSNTNTLKQCFYNFFHYCPLKELFKKYFLITTAIPPRNVNTTDTHCTSVYILWPSDGPQTTLRSKISSSQELFFISLEVIKSSLLIINTSRQENAECEEKKNDHR